MYEHPKRLHDDEAQRAGMEENGEYRFVRPEAPHRVYADAGYIPQSEAPELKKKNYMPPPEPPRREKNRGMHASTVVALCVICGILGGIVGGLTGSLLGKEKNDDPSVMSQPSLAPAEQAQESSAPQSSGTPVSSGELLTGELSGSAVYALGCPQTVGITTSVTTRNFFGQVSTSSVTGSGFIVTEDGYILTNYHVIQAAHQGGYDISVMLHSGESYAASIVGYENDGTDLAVLKIEAEGLSPAALGNSDEILVGETVYAIGNPLGELSYTMTTGSVSALDRNITSQNSYPGEMETVNAFQFDAAVNEGNSGGPLYNSLGQVIGIVTAKYSSEGVEGLGFAIPINEAISVANELIEHGYVSGKAMLGISGETVSASVAKYYGMAQGVYVWNVSDGGCADRAGLRPGDIITALGDTVVTSVSELNAAQRDYRAGDTGALTVFRDGEYLNVEVVFDEQRPD